MSIFFIVLVLNKFSLQKITFSFNFTISIQLTDQYYFLLQYFFSDSESFRDTNILYNSEIFQTYNFHFFIQPLKKQETFKM